MCFKGSFGRLLMPRLSSGTHSSKNMLVISELSAIPARSVYILAGLWAISTSALFGN